MLGLIAKILVPLMPVIAKILSILLDKWKESAIKEKNKEISKLPLTESGKKKMKECTSDKEKVSDAHKKFNDFLDQFQETHKQLKIKTKL